LEYSGYPQEVRDCRISANGTAAVFVTVPKTSGGGFVDAGPLSVNWVDLRTGRSVQLDTDAGPGFLVFMMQKTEDDWINCIADISPDGRLVATTEGSSSLMGNGTITIHNPSKGTKEVISGDAGAFLSSGTDYCPAFHPNGKGICFIRLVNSAGSPDCSIVYRDIVSGEETTFDAGISEWNSIAYNSYAMVPYFMFMQGGDRRNPRALVIDNYFEPQFGNLEPWPQVEVVEIGSDPPSYKVVDSFTMEGRPSWREHLIRMNPQSMSIYGGYPSPQGFAGTQESSEYHVAFVGGKDLIRLNTGDWCLVPLGKDEPREIVNPPFQDFEIIGSTGP
jgi:hypothetical protein